MEITEKYFGGQSMNYLRGNENNNYFLLIKYLGNPMVKYNKCNSLSFRVILLQIILIGFLT